MKKQDIQQIREWLLDRLELLHSSNPPSFPREVEVLEKILIMTTEVMRK